MAGTEYHFDTRIRRRHIPLITQQRRLRHLRSVSARNITLINSCTDSETALVFTLHIKPDSTEFYTSEVISGSLNPTWKDFESSNFPDSIDAASSYVFLKVWNVSEEKHLLIEWLVYFSGLVFVGEQIPKEGKNFKPNTIIFGMSEGYYGCIDCYQHSSGIVNDYLSKNIWTVDFSGLRTSYTLNTLSRIKTIERAIKQTQAAVQRRRNSISAKLQSGQAMHQLHAERELLKIKISVLKTELQSQEKSAHSVEKEIACYKDDLEQKRNELSRKADEHKKLMEKCIELSKTYCEYRETLLKTEAQLNFRRKQLISELSWIYPIVQFPDHNGYSIHNVHLPNSEKFLGHDETMIAIALGYVCHIVLMISYFLNVPLRYAIHFYGSRSTITDHISSSLPEKTREFPLFSKGKDRRCFEYGVFLLNKNIAQLRIFCGLITRDLSATLPNLSNLVESRLSVHSDNYGGIYNPALLQRSINTDSKVPLPLDRTSQNCFPKLTDGQENTLPPCQIKISDSEIEFLKREMEAMMPNTVGSNQDTLQTLPKSKDNALSCSLDKGLNDIKLLEKSLHTTITEEKQLPSKSKVQVKHLKQTSHHSSYPNLNATLQVAETYSAPNLDAHLSSTPPRVWTAESSRTNSEDEHADEGLRLKTKPAVLNDSVFYIPSELPSNTKQMLPYSNNCPGGEQELARSTVIDDDFTADLSLRTEQLASKKSSFQMQKLRSSSNEEENLPFA